MAPPTKQFQRKKEDFTCDVCGFRVEGTEYTDHCPKCLWSKHIDINPGDRLATCKGLMEPIGCSLKHGKKMLHYQCRGCSHTHKVEASPEDNLEILVELSQGPVTD